MDFLQKDISLSAFRESTSVYKVIAARAEPVKSTRVRDFSIKPDSMSGKKAETKNSSSCMMDSLLNECGTSVKRGKGSLQFYSHRLGIGILFSE